MNIDRMDRIRKDIKTAVSKLRVFRADGKNKEYRTLADSLDTLFRIHNDYKVEQPNIDFITGTTNEIKLEMDFLQMTNSKHLISDNLKSYHDGLTSFEKLNKIVQNNVQYINTFKRVVKFPQGVNIMTTEVTND